MGYLPQHARKASGLPLSVRQVVRTGITGKTGILRQTPAADVQFCEAMIRRVGLSELADAPVATLSGGQLQRVYIARALSSRPTLLLLDEPTTGIDPAGQQQFIEFLQEIRSELNLTVIFVSHDLRAVAAISDRIACVNVTLHSHDTADRLPPEVVYRTFACDLEALGLREPAAAQEPAAVPEIGSAPR